MKSFFVIAHNYSLIMKDNVSLNQKKNQLLITFRSCRNCIKKSNVSFCKYIWDVSNDMIC